MGQRGSGGRRHRPRRACRAHRAQRGPPGGQEGAGSDPPHGRLAVVVASSSPGPKPLPASERSSHRQAFRSSASAALVAHGSLHATPRSRYRTPLLHDTTTGTAWCRERQCRRPRAMASTGLSTASWCLVAPLWETPGRWWINPPRRRLGAAVTGPRHDSTVPRPARTGRPMPRRRTSMTSSATASPSPEATARARQPCR